jgi:hypothetical protein
MDQDDDDHFNYWFLYGCTKFPDPNNDEIYIVVCTNHNQFDIRFVLFIVLLSIMMSFSMYRCYMSIFNARKEINEEMDVSDYIEMPQDKIGDDEI